jgi:hypothetical protein
MFYNIGHRTECLVYKSFDSAQNQNRPEPERSHEDGEVYYDIASMGLVQNVLVTCFTVNDIEMDTCEIRLAFRPLETSAAVGGPAPEVVVSLENSCVRPGGDFINILRS